MSKFKIKMTLLLLVCMLIASSTPAAASGSAESDHHMVELTVAQTVEKVEGKTPAFTYQIIPTDNTESLPQNGNEMTLEGTVNGKWIFDLDQLQVGEILNYKVIQEDSDNSDFTKDDRVYSLEIIGLQGEEGVYPQLILTEDGEKTDTVAYNSKFIGTPEETPSETPETTTPVRDDSVKTVSNVVTKEAGMNTNTGLNSSSLTLLAAIGATTVAALFFILYKKEREA